jgi:predicted aspartyl protease
VSYLTLLLITALVLEDGAATATPPTPAPQSSVPQGDGKGTFKFNARFVPKEQRAPVVYESPTGAILFRAKIADREVWAMLDTGASYSLMDIELARAAGLTIGSEEKPIKTSRGEMMMRRVSDVSILIPGQFEARYSPLAAVDMSAVSAVIGRKIEFVLGPDFLSAMVLAVDPSKRTFQLAPSGAFKAPPGSKTITLQNGKIEVTIGNEKALVKIDTGYNGQLNLTPTAWERIVPKDAATGTAIHTGAEGRSYAKKAVLLPEIEIGSIRMTDVLVSEWPDRPEDGVLGTGLLGKFRFALDIKMGMLWLGSAPPPSVSK